MDKINTIQGNSLILKFSISVSKYFFLTWNPVLDLRYLNKRNILICDHKLLGP